MSLRKLAAAVGVLMTTALLSACASVPISGPVTTSMPQKQGDDPAVFMPNPPQDGMSREDVVRGFVTAASAGRDYRVAKEFLTAGFAASWRPDESVLLHTLPWKVGEEDGDRVRLTVPAVGQVDAEGRLGTPSDPMPTNTYQLEKVRGQWRISGGPDGVVLTETVFPQVFSATRLQFFDPSYKRLVPDVRWFPRRDDLAPLIVHALLGTQAPVLQEVTEPVFPAGTRLAAPVRSTGGVTTVSVDLPGAQPDEQMTDRMQQALVQSLQKSAVRLIVDGRVAPAASQLQLDQPSITNAVVVADGRFGALNAQGGISEDRELGPRIVQLKPSAVTLRAGERIAAVRAADGRISLVVRDRPAKVIDGRDDLSAPTMDQLGWTYSVPENGTGGLRVTSSSGRSYAVRTELDTTGAVSIEVSTDGTRLLVLRRGGAGAEAYVAGILRADDGRPVGLTTDRIPIELDPAASVLDATWVDQATVGVLINNASVQSVVTQQLGGLVAPLNLLSGARTIVGGTGLQDLRAWSGTGGLVKWSPSTNSWGLDSPASLQVDVLAVQR